MTEWQTYTPFDTLLTQAYLHRALVLQGLGRNEVADIHSVTFYLNVKLKIDDNDNTMTFLALSGWRRLMDTITVDLVVNNNRTWLVAGATAVQRWFSGGTDYGFGNAITVPTTYHFTYPAPVTVAGPQVFVVFSEGANVITRDARCTIVYTRRKVSMAEKVRLMRQTSWEGQD